MNLAATVVHAAVLGAAGWAGGSPRAIGVVAGLVVCQWVESAAVAERPDVVDGSARAIGLLILGVVLSSLLLPGPGIDLGWVFAVCGLGLRIWAIRTLGSGFLDGVARMPGSVRSDHGPYRWLRHPADLGVLAITAGIVLVLGSGAGAVVWFGLAGLLAWRTRAEDRLWGPS